MSPDETCLFFFFFVFKTKNRLHGSAEKGKSEQRKTGKREKAIWSIVYCVLFSGVFGFCPILFYFFISIFFTFKCHETFDFLVTRKA